MTGSTKGSLDDAIDRLPKEGGVVRIPWGGDRSAGVDAEVDVVDSDRLGVKVRGVRIHRERPVDISEEARALPDRMRSLPDRIAPVEVAPELGGARLRSRPDEVRHNEFFEVDVEPNRTSIRKTRMGEDGERAPADFTLTREQLDRLIDEASG